MIANTLRKVTPQWARQVVPPVIKKWMVPKQAWVSLPSYSYFQQLMLNYQVKNLKHVDPESFKRQISAFLELQDHQMEGFKNPEKQRDLSIKFHWGHDHDFGSFFLPGRMKSRHIGLITTFVDQFQAMPRSLDGLRVLDIGCWTGGTSLLLAAMGAHVVAIEEVKKYVDCVNYLKAAFGIDRLEARNLSLFDCTAAEFQDAFDIVLYAGVFYHVSDPVLSLRIVFNCLRDGGTCLLETAALRSNKLVLSYKGPAAITHGRRENLSRSGWNWFFPSPPTIAQMMDDVGFSDVQVSDVIGGRAYAVAKRKTHTDISRGGLSVRTIR